MTTTKKKSKKRKKTNRWKRSIKWLEDYIKVEYGWDIIYTNKAESFVNVIKEIVLIDTRHNDETIFYLFLHELGHIKISRMKEYRTRFEKIINERSQVSLVYKLCIVEEEIEAWNLGYEFALENGLPMRRKRFEELKASLVSTYMIWSNNRKHPHEEFSRKKKQHTQQGYSTSSPLLQEKIIDNTT